MLQVLVIVPGGSGPGGADGRDLAALLTLPSGVAEGLRFTVATPAGDPPAVDESTLAWAMQDSEEDWAYLAALGERSRPTLAALSEGDIRTLGLLTCRTLRDGLVTDAGVSPSEVQSLVLQTVEESRNRLAPFDQVFFKLCEEQPALVGVDGKACYEQACSALEQQCQQRAGDVRSVLSGSGALTEPVGLDDVVTPQREWDVVLVPGGGEQVRALDTDRRLGAILTSARKAGAPVGVVGAGSAALLSVDDGPDGWIFDGIVLVAPPDPSYSFLADRTWSDRSVRNDLLRRGAIVDESGPDWTSRLVDDRGVVSGRNSRCATAVYATTILQARRQ